MLSKRKKIGEHFPQTSDSCTAEIPSTEQEISEVTEVKDARDQEITVSEMVVFDELKLTAEFTGSKEIHIPLDGGGEIKYVTHNPARLVNKGRYGLLRKAETIGAEVSGGIEIEVRDGKIYEKKYDYPKKIVKLKSGDEIIDLTANLCRTLITKSRIVENKIRPLIKKIDLRETFDIDKNNNEITNIDEDIIIKILESSIENLDVKFTEDGEYSEILRLIKEKREIKKNMAEYNVWNMVDIDSTFPDGSNPSYVISKSEDLKNDFCDKLCRMEVIASGSSISRLVEFKGAVTVHVHPLALKLPEDIRRDNESAVNSYLKPFSARRPEEENYEHLKKRLLYDMDVKIHRLNFDIEQYEEGMENGLAQSKLEIRVLRAKKATTGTTVEKEAVVADLDSFGLLDSFDTKTGEKLSVNQQLEKFIEDSEKDSQTMVSNIEMENKKILDSLKTVRDYYSDMTEKVRNLQGEELAKEALDIGTYTPSAQDVITLNKSDNWITVGDKRVKIDKIDHALGSVLYIIEENSDKLKIVNIQGDQYSVRLINVEDFEKNSFDSLKNSEDLAEENK